MTFRSRLIALLSALALLASACGGAESPAEDLVAASGAPAAASSDDDQASAGPDLGLLGQGSLEGQDVVVWFWAEW